MRKNYFFLSALFFSISGFAQQKKADLLIYNATIYTIDHSFSIASALAVYEGKIVAVGRTPDLLQQFQAVEKIDATGKFIYPGFIDAHSHFYGYGFELQTANLAGASSWDEIIERLKTFSKGNTSGWLMGRGWDQNRWPVKEFPTSDKLDELFPDRPVALTRVDGHALIVNQKALSIAGITSESKVNGGAIELANGKPTGVLIDNAMQLVYSKIPSPTETEATKALLDAQRNCFAAGLTTVSDCGIDHQQVLLLDKLQNEGKLRMRVYAMLSDKLENYDFLFKRGKIKTHRLDVRSFKVYADGALGSRGACLLEPYQDKPGWSGFLLSSQMHFDSVASIIRQHGFQMCTHAIGDSGNRVILKIYGKYLKGSNKERWRIEHAQVINQSDFELFGRYNIVPSVQPTHATSDMYWAADRLGPKRVRGAYAYKQLLQQNGWIPLGTDFPVEDIDPLKTFFASVFRQDQKGFPAKGFQMENALSRKETLKGMTIWAAMANFEEQEKGSIEKGKDADLVVLDQDIMTISVKDFFKTRVLMTILNGEKVYEQKQ